MQGLIEHLGGGQVAPEAHLAGRAEGAGERAAALGGEQTDRLPSRKRISTASTGTPSPVRNKVLTVPSRERASCSTSSVEKGIRSASRERSAAGTSVISA